MRFYRHTRGNYWSSSKLAKKLYSIVGVKTLAYGTFEDWDEWETTTQSNHPKLYYLIETLFNKAQNIVMFPTDVIWSIKSYIKNRFKYKTHYLQTKLEVGAYHEIDERILHGLFETLVEFVEVELAHMQQYSKNWKKPKLDRSAEAGLEYLEWEMNLTDDGIHFTYQAMNAQKQYELYNWWKNVRPNRPDPYEASGYNAYYEEVYGTRVLWSLRYQGTERQYEELMRLSKVVDSIEKSYREEDERMMIELIKHRSGLWT